MSSLQPTRSPSPELPIRASMDLAKVNTDVTSQVTTSASGHTPFFSTKDEALHEARPLAASSAHATSHQRPSPPRLAPTLPLWKTMPHAAQGSVQQPTVPAFHDNQSQAKCYLANEPIGQSSEGLHEVVHQDSERITLGEIPSIKIRPWTSSLGVLDVCSQKVVKPLAQHIDGLKHIAIPTIKLAGLPASASLTHAAIAKTIACISLNQHGRPCPLSATPFAMIALLSWATGITAMIAGRFWNKETGPLSRYRHENTKKTIMMAHFVLNYLFGFLLLHTPSLPSSCPRLACGLYLMLTNDVTLSFVYAMGYVTLNLFYYLDYRLDFLRDRFEDMHLPANPQTAHFIPFSPAIRLS